MNAVQVRRRDHRDLEVISRLLEDAAERQRAKGGPASVPPGVTALNSLRGDGLVALADDRVVGTVSFRVRGGRLHLFDLVVALRYRRNGVAGRLVAELESIARGARAKVLTLQTVAEGDAAAAFERLGFRTHSTKKDVFFAQESDRAFTTVYMVKRLSDQMDQTTGRWW